MWRSSGTCRNRAENQAANAADCWRLQNPRYGMRSRLPMSPGKHYDVAGCTSEGSVNPGQSKAGVFQMIVLCVVPTVHRVAGFTRSGESGAYMIENRSLKILLMHETHAVDNPTNCPVAAPLWQPSHSTNACAPTSGSGSNARGSHPVKHSIL